MTVNFGISAARRLAERPRLGGGGGHGPEQTALHGRGRRARRGCHHGLQQFLAHGAYKQDGYAEGTLSTIGINPDGTVVGRYSNGQGQNLWQIPVCRFTSEDGLRREGSNLFSATEEAGQMEMAWPERKTTAP